MEKHKFEDIFFDQKDVKKLSTQIVPSKGKNLSCKGIVVITEFQIGIRNIFPIMNKSEDKIINAGGPVKLIETRKRFHPAPYHKSLIKY